MVKFSEDEWSLIRQAVLGMVNSERTLLAVSVDQSQEASVKFHKNRLMEYEMLLKKVPSETSFCG